MRPLSRNIHRELDAAAVADGKQHTERGARRPSRLFYLGLLYTVSWALVFFHHFSTGVQSSGDATAGGASAFFSASRIFRQDPCAGRYVYMYDLPPRFNADLVRQCRRISGSPDVCKDVANDGFGPPITWTGGDEGGWLPDRGAYNTDQYMLGIIFHARMRRHECLTADPAAASAVYVPFYAGLDAAMHLDNPDLAVRDALSRDLVDWLEQRPEWRAMGGRDHFLVSGRGTWDFLRGPDADGWGNALMTYPAIRNATFLTTEASPWHGHDFAVPFPSHFHPSSDADVTDWQDRMRHAQRGLLWCFAGGPRGGDMGTVRAQIIKQCGRSSQCSLLGKSAVTKPGHYAAGHAMRLLESAEFCMQPRGDGYTRKSTFDAILAGCIPVFFHPVSAYLQYTWHLPRDYRSYSVFIPAGDVGRNASIEEVLSKIPSEKVARMREQVIRLIPTVMYRDPAAKGVTFKDAVDVALERVIHRVAKRRRAAAEGRELVDSVDGGDSWKYDLMLEDGQKKIGPHEFDQYVYMHLAANLVG
ncbi:hypothetical protein CFC21_039094 [Triticum aestivum]|uniref:Exostosin GT47 domain-containing protein n=3 Tax=Triticum TaxID=4564 RepID=A0A9R1FEJ9_WHEAT|nr:xyloglucan galactosyltransferase KATAMARI1 homolog [Triticum aestivum]KAF7027023.1 hypothetical protein CFC21_039094 [Triticum aestivum]CDM80497.1 unnamed protein product [Triticum aestivum]VAH71160.1 unnamed protein product [Triticum turgidum subsp. durum]